MPVNLFEKAVNWRIAKEMGLSEKQPPWLVKGLLLSNAQQMISGPSMYGMKTWLAMTMAHVIGTGKPVGELMPGVKEPQSILMIATESSLRNFGQRAKAIENYHGTELVDENSHVLIRDHINLDDAKQVGDLVDYIKEYDIKAAFFDTLAKSMRGDENSSQDAGRVIYGLEAIVRET